MVWARLCGHLLPLLSRRGRSFSLTLCKELNSVGIFTNVFIWPRHIFCNQIMLTNSAALFLDFWRRSTQTYPSASDIRELGRPSSISSIPWKGSSVTPHTELLGHYGDGIIQVLKAVVLCYSGLTEQSRIAKR